MSVGIALRERNSHMKRAPVKLGHERLRRLPVPDLLTLIATGSEEAFEIIYERHGMHLLALARTLLTRKHPLRNQYDSDDLVALG
jgi:hypothetical protein